MYTANSPKELKKLMKEDKFPILVKDKKAKKVVETLESIKSKGIKETAKEEIRSAVINILAGTVILKTFSEVATITIVGISLTTIVALYAIYKGKNIKLKYNTDGSIDRIKYGKLKKKLSTKRLL